MATVVTVVVLMAAVGLVLLARSVRIVKQYEQGVLFRFGRVLGVRQPDFQLIAPFMDVMHRVTLRIVTRVRKCCGSSVGHHLTRLRGRPGRRG